MIECRMIYYPITTRRHSRSENARTEIYLPKRDLLFGYFRFGDAKNFEVVARGGIENSVDSAVAFSMASCFIFNALFACQEFEKNRITFFRFSRNTHYMGNGRSRR